jgi:uncharacterized protein YcaQ
VLYGDKFVARFEPGWDKKTKSIIIKNWWWEQGVKPAKKMNEELEKCFRKFAGYLGAEIIKADEKAAGINGLEWLK